MEGKEITYDESAFDMVEKNIIDQLMRIIDQERLSQDESKYVMNQQELDELKEELENQNLIIK